MKFWWKRVFSFFSKLIYCKNVIYFQTETVNWLNRIPKMIIYHILDIFFVFLHTFLIFFNLFGWIWRKTRLLNLITLLLTGGSWFILGIFYGIGYCPLTDWHFRILEILGKTGLPNSYITYLAERLTGIRFKPSLVDGLTLGCFVTALVISVTFNILDFRKKRRMPGC